MRAHLAQVDFAGFVKQFDRLIAAEENGKNIKLVDTDRIYFILWWIEWSRNGTN